MGWEKQSEVKKRHKRVVHGVVRGGGADMPTAGPTESMQVNNISVELNIPVTDLFLTLLELEVKMW